MKKWYLEHEIRFVKINRGYLSNRAHNSAKFQRIVVLDKLHNLIYPQETNQLDISIMFDHYKRRHMNSGDKYFKPKTKPPTVE